MVQDDSITPAKRARQELSFKDVIDGKGQDKPGYQKLVFCLEQARENGIRYCWVDTCCIDKSNSAELSEAIISMFRWYRDAHKCLVYLSDVSAKPYADNARPSWVAWESDFRRSKWFTRGWTLQELLAPTKVEFFSKEEEYIGSKSSLDHSICDTTGIPIDALRGKPLPEYDVNVRLSWVNSRETTREEDIAYCLLGIFDVTVIQAYGEGKERAWARLIREIQASSPEEVLKQGRSSLREQSNTLVATPTKHSKIGNISSPDVYYDNLLGSLKFDELDIRRRTIKTAHRQTCKWILTDQQYLDWLDIDKQREHGGFLWIKGKAGSGKSTLMKYLCTHETSRMRVENHILISFFFNARGDSIERSVSGAYRALLVQLLRHRPSLQEVFQILGPSASDITIDYQWDLETLKTLLSEAFQAVGETYVMCFIDALDECDEEEIRDMIILLESVCEDVMSTGSVIRICLASRYYPHISIKKGLTLELEGKEGHTQDITNYLESALRIGDSKLANQIRSEVRMKASGVFIWVVLVVAMLNKDFDRGHMDALQKRLSEIPSSISKLFKDILTKDLRNADRMILCIQWVLFAKEPLTPDELHIAILHGLENELPATTEDSHFRTEAARKFILDASKGLTETTKSGRKLTVQFIHESIKDFLIKEGGFRNLYSDLADELEGKSHERLKRCCLSYMNNYLKEKQSTPFIPDASPLETQLIESRPFLSYAVRSVLYHADKAAADGVSQALFLSDFKYSEWAKLVDQFENIKPLRDTRGMSLLQRLVMIDASNLIKEHKGAHMFLEVETDGSDTPLSMAIALRHVAALQSLIDAHCARLIAVTGLPSSGIIAELIQRWSRDDKLRRDINWTWNLWVNPPSEPTFPAYSGPQLHLQILYATYHYLRADKPIKEHYLRAVLPSAAEAGHLPLVKQMLDEGADANLPSEHGRYALVQALGMRNKQADSFQADGDVEQMTKMLLDKGADADVSDRDGITPLARASAAGNECIVRLLLERGANPNGYVYNNRSLFAPYVSESRPAVKPFGLRRQQIIKRLLGNDAESDDISDGIASPLSLAARNGWVEGLAILIEWGADVNHTGIDRIGPLASASGAGKLEIVEKLLELGADVNGGEQSAQSPLAEASVRGHEAVVKTLLQRGADAAKHIYGTAPLLCYTYWNGHVRVATTLLEHGVDKHGNDPRYTISLSQATVMRGFKLAKALLDKGADVDGKNHPGWSPLETACILGDKYIAQLLIDRGANVTGKGSRRPNKKAMEWAFRRQRRHIVDAMLKVGAEPWNSSDRADAGWNYFGLSALE